MTEQVYTLGVFLLRALYRVAGWINPKAQKFRKGRKDQEPILKTTFPLPSSDVLVWFHCSSLGEFEQGRPIIEALKGWKPGLKILLTFFSPSGYEVRKNYEHADYIFYLPWDTRGNAQWFAETVRPNLAIFVKYEFWYHYSQALKNRNIPLISTSTILRPEQNFFKPYGSFFRRILKNFQFFFAQNQESVDLLKGIGITSVALTGDTRFDRVNQIVKNRSENSIAFHFKNKKKVMVIGSAWPEDMAVLVPFINKHLSDLKFIIAPHEIQESFLQSIEKSVKGVTLRHSSPDVLQRGINADVLLIDNIGLLSQLYGYGEYAFVGGAYKDGLHNILEAACFGIPIFFGDKSYRKFQEANDLIVRGGAFAIRNGAHLDSAFAKLEDTPSAYQEACRTTQAYVQENLGATEKITEYCKKILG